LECLEGGEVASYACLLHGLFSVVNSSFVGLVLHDVGKAQCSQLGGYCKTMQVEWKSRMTGLACKL
jgi:hypothetical protein